MARVLDKNFDWKIFKVNILESSINNNIIKETPIITEVTSESLSKIFNLGDQVKIIYGDNINMTGRVVRQEGDYIYILNIEMNKEVCVRKLFVTLFND